MSVAAAAVVVEADVVVDAVAVVTPSSVPFKLPVQIPAISN